MQRDWRVPQRRLCEKKGGAVPTVTTRKVLEGLFLLQNGGAELEFMPHRDIFPLFFGQGDDIDSAARLKLPQSAFAGGTRSYAHTTHPSSNAASLYLGRAFISKNPISSIRSTPTAANGIFSILWGFMPSCVDQSTFRFPK